MTLEYIASEEEKVLIDFINFCCRENLGELRTDLLSYLDHASKRLTQDKKDRIMRDIERVNAMQSPDKTKYTPN